MNDRAQSHASQLLLLVVLALVVPPLCTHAVWDNTAVAEHVSELWGHHGERWSPTSRILDVSNAGFEARIASGILSTSALGRTQIELGSHHCLQSDTSGG